MTAMTRLTWTDERMDDLSRQVDNGFARVHTDVDSLRRELCGELESEIGSSRAETKAEFTSVRAEFAAVRKEMKQEFAAVRTEMKQEFAAVRAEMTQEFASVRKEIKQEFAAVRKEMKGEFAELRTDNRLLREEMSQGFGELGARIAESNAQQAARIDGLVRVMIGAMGAGFFTLAAIVIASVL